MNNKKLSICIPTRNRPKQLQSLISELKKQIRVNNFINKIEILIGDNTDIPELFLDFSDEASEFIRYTKNNGNIGYARNVNNLIFSAVGDYVWLLSDDDPLTQDAVKKIFSSLNDSRGINYLTFDSARETANGIKHRIYFNDIKKNYYSEGQEFLAEHWGSVIYISINIFNRRNMMKHIIENQLFSNVNEQFQNSLLCISFISKYGKIKIIEEELIYADQNVGKRYSDLTEIKTTVVNHPKLNLQLQSLGVIETMLASHLDIIHGKFIGTALRNVVRINLGLTTFNASKYYKLGSSAI